MSGSTSVRFRNSCEWILHKLDQGISTGAFGNLEIVFSCSITELQGNHELWITSPVSSLRFRVTIGAIEDAWIRSSNKFRTLIPRTDDQQIVSLSKLENSLISGRRSSGITSSNDKEFLKICWKIFCWVCKELNLFQSCNFAYDRWSAYRFILFDLSLVRELSLSNCGIMDDDLKCLLHALVQSKSPFTLKVLDLSRNCITSEGVLYLRHYLVGEENPISSNTNSQPYPVLQCIDLQRNPIGNKGAQVLSTIIGNKKASKLRTLNLEKVGISDDGILCLSKAMVFSKLSQLFVGQNYASTSAWIESLFFAQRCNTLVDFFAQMLTRKPEIVCTKSENLNHFPISDELVSSIKTLNLSGWDLSEKCNVDRVALLLKHCPALETLNLSECSLVDSNATIILQTIEDLCQRCLKKLDLSRNDLSDSSLFTVTNFISSASSTVLNIRIDNNQFSSLALKKFVSSLARCSIQLRRLSLAGNKLDHECILAFFKGFVQNTCLQEVDLSIAGRPVLLSSHDFVFSEFVEKNTALRELKAYGIQLQSREVDHLNEHFRRNVTLTKFEGVDFLNKSTILSRNYHWAVKTKFILCLRRCGFLKRSNFDYSILGLVFHYMGI